MPLDSISAPRMPAPWTPRRILITHDRSDGLGAYLLARRPKLEVRATTPSRVSADDLNWAEVYLGFRPPPHPWGTVRWIHSTGAGVDRYLFRTSLPDHILLTRSSEDFGPQIGEYCLARALAVTQRLAGFAEDQRAHRWSGLLPETLAGTRALIVGTGLVGRGIARAFVGQGVLVDGVSRTGGSAEPFSTVWPVDRIAEAVTGARWLVLAAPLTEATWHLFNADLLARADGAWLINVARGALVDEAALPAAIDAGHVGGAALDVFEAEPLRPESPLWDHPRVMITPHCSGVTGIAAAGDGFLACLEAVERGEQPEWAVDRHAGY